MLAAYSTMEVLLEYENSRRPLKPSGGIVTQSLLEDEFEKRAGEVR